MTYTGFKIPDNCKTTNFSFIQNKDYEIIFNILFYFNTISTLYIACIHVMMRLLNQIYI